MTVSTTTALHAQTLQIDLSVERYFADEDDGETDLAHHQCWKSAEKILATRKYTFGEDCEVCLDIDWTPLVSHLQRVCESNQDFMEARRSGRIKEYFEGRSFPGGPLIIGCKATARAKSGTIPVHIPFASMLEAHLYDVFLVLNISTPASFALRRAVIKASGIEFSPTIDLEPGRIELTCMETQRGRWYAPRRSMSIEKTCAWFFEVRQGFSQVPQSRMEKVLFGLLHLSKGEISGATIVWLFYSLETLLDAKAGENFQAITRRIQLLLQLDEQQRGELRKNLRAMYDLRSAFVHGGLEIIHPMHDEVLDPRVDERYWTLVDSAEFGFALLLKIIQEVVERGLREPQFDEVIR